MPVSLMPEDLSKGFGIQAGLHRVVSSEWMVHQFPPNKEGKQSEAFVCWAIGYQPIDAAGKPIGDVETDYSLKVAPAFGETLDKAKFAPAQTPGQPLPLRVGSKGPFLEAVGDQAAINERSKIGIFLKHLFSLGFDKQKFAASNMAVSLLVGTEGDVFELVSQNDGTDESGKQFKPTKIPAFKTIRKFGYEGGGAPVQQVNGVAAASNGATAASGDPKATAIQILEGLAAKYKEKGSMPLADMVKGVLPVWTKLTPRPSTADRDAAKKLLESPDFYAAEDVQAIAVLDGSDVMFA